MRRDIQQRALRRHGTKRRRDGGQDDQKQFLDKEGARGRELPVVGGRARPRVQPRPSGNLVRSFQKTTRARQRRERVIEGGLRLFESSAGAGTTATSTRSAATGPSSSARSPASPASFSRVFSSTPRRRRGSSESRRRRGREPDRLKGRVAAAPRVPRGSSAEPVPRVPRGSSAEPVRAGSSPPPRRRRGSRHRQHALAPRFAPRETRPRRLRVDDALRPEAAAHDGGRRAARRRRGHHGVHDQDVR